MISLLFGLTLHGVVDQVDGGWALVEWERADFGHVPVELLPEDVREGDLVTLRLRRGGPLSTIHTEVGSIDLPPGVAPRGWRAVVTRGSTRRRKR